VIEVIGVIFTLISVILTIRVNKYCWYFGIIGVIFYMILFYQNNLWGNFGLQFLFFFQNIIGIVNWNKNTREISWVENKVNLIMYTILLYPIFYFITIKSSMPICDSLITLFSVVATYLLIYKKIESWIYWLLVDIIGVYMFYKIGLYLTMSLYLTFMVTAVIGLVKWIKIKRIRERNL